MARLSEKRQSRLLIHRTRASPLREMSEFGHSGLRFDGEGIADDKGTEETVSGEVSRDVISGAVMASRGVETGVRTVSRNVMSRRRAAFKEIKPSAGMTSREVKASVSVTSRFQQKRAIKKAYVTARAGRLGRNAESFGAAYEVAASALHRSAEAASADAASSGLAGKAAQLISRHRGGVIAVVLGAALLMMSSSFLSSCSLMMSSVTSSGVMSTYPSEDEDMLAAQTQYKSLEDELQEYLDSYESTHDFDEYRYELDEVGHDPYVLISILTAMKAGSWKIGEVEDLLQKLFNAQYTLTEDVEVETRYRTETDTWTDEEGNEHTDTYEVPYDYYICTVTLENADLSHLPADLMDEDHLSLYSVYMATLGNRPDLFGESTYIAKYYGNQSNYEVSAEALKDAQFAAMITEAEKYLGYPYVWGGSSPATSFDCSGFVCWVINHSDIGRNVGRMTAEGLRGVCSYVPPSKAKPGDLIFFEKTYKTSGASHVGIYVGDGMMIHCGDPIQYTSIDTSYWQSHFLQYGRLPGS